MVVSKGSARGGAGLLAALAAVVVPIALLAAGAAGVPDSPVHSHASARSAPAALTLSASALSRPG